MIKKFFAALAILVVILAVVVAMQPDDFYVERSITIAAAPDVVFSKINDLHIWETWSPWAKLDPKMQMTYEGAPSGVGAISGWNGNDEVGQGRSTILESRPNQYIKIQLDFMRPMEATNMTEFQFSDKSGQTLVKWNMSGKNNFIGKAVGLVMNCEKMVGDQFDEGLANLKKISEASTSNL